MSNVYVHFSQISFPARYSVVNFQFEMETPGPYVWPVKRQQVAARRSLVLCGGPKRQAASLSLADRGRGGGRLPTRGGGVGRSSSRGRSHRAPAARLPAFTRGLLLFSCGEEKTSSHIPPEKWSKWRRQSRIFSQIFFHLCDAAENGAPHRALIHALGFGNLPVGHAEDKVSVHPAEPSRTLGLFVPKWSRQETTTPAQRCTVRAHEMTQFFMYLQISRCWPE